MTQKKPRFEFVEFYKAKKNPKFKSFLGTLHIYFIDCQMDIRGISVTRNGKRLFYILPHFSSFDEELQKNVKYPILRFTNEDDQKELIDFLQTEITPEILKMMK